MGAHTDHCYICTWLLLLPVLTSGFFHAAPISCNLRSHSAAFGVRGSEQCRLQAQDTKLTAVRQSGGEKIIPKISFSLLSFSSLIIGWYQGTLLKKWSLVGNYLFCVSGCVPPGAVALPCAGDRAWALPQWPVPHGQGQGTGCATAQVTWWGKRGWICAVVCKNHLLEQSLRSWVIRVGFGWRAAGRREWRFAVWMISGQGSWGCEWLWLECPHESRWKWEMGEWFMCTLSRCVGGVLIQPLRNVWTRCCSITRKAQDVLNLAWCVGSALVKGAKNQTDALEHFGGKRVEEAHLKV